jgi:hypothetical protein
LLQALVVALGLEMKANFERRTKGNTIFGACTRKLLCERNEKAAAEH